MHGPTQKIGRTCLFAAISLIACVSSLIGTELLVSDNFGNQILRFNPDNGLLLGPLVPSASGLLDGPTGMRIGPDGQLWVTNQNRNEVRRFDLATGASLGVFVSNATTSANLNGSSDLGFGPDGRLYVGNFLGTSVDRFDATTGTALGPFTQGGPLNGVTHLGWGPNEDLFVSSFNTNEVLRYDGVTGAFLGSFASGNGLNGPATFRFHNGSLFVASLLSQSVLKFNGTTGAFESVFATLPAFGTAEPFPSDLLIRPDGSMLVSLTGQGAIVALDANGGNLGVFASGGGLLVPGQMLVSPIPEPGTWLGLVIVGWAILRSRRGAPTCAAR